MLSILQRQAKILEKELKEKQKECLDLSYANSDLRESVKTKDIRIEVLEAELAALKQQQVVENHVETEETGEGKNHLDLNALLAELNDKFEKCKHDLVFAELQSSMLKLQQATKEMVHLSGLRKLEAALAEANDEISTLRIIDRKIETSELELMQVKDDLKRRDEEIEFLLHVHEASSGYDWTNNRTSNGTESMNSSTPSTQIYAAGSGIKAISILSSSSQIQTEQDASISFLVELGATTETAIEVLQATGGDVDKAAAVLFP